MGAVTGGFVRYVYKCSSTYQCVGLCKYKGESSYVCFDLLLQQNSIETHKGHHICPLISSCNCTLQQTLGSNDNYDADSSQVWHHRRHYYTAWRDEVYAHLLFTSTEGRDAVQSRWRLAEPSARRRAEEELRRIQPGG